MALIAATPSCNKTTIHRILSSIILTYPRSKITHIDKIANVAPSDVNIQLTFLSPESHKVRARPIPRVILGLDSNLVACVWSKLGK